MASSLVVLRFDTPEGAEQGLTLAAKLQKEHLFELLDAATVTWRKAKKKPKTRHVRDSTCAGACDGAFSGMLFGWLFFAPFLGAAFGDAIGALSAHFGIGKDFLDQVRGKVTPGSSAVFLLVVQVTTDRVVEAFKAAPKFEVIASNLSHELTRSSRLLSSVAAKRRGVAAEANDQRWQGVTFDPVGQPTRLVSTGLERSCDWIRACTRSPYRRQPIRRAPAPTSREYENAAGGVAAGLFNVSFARQSAVARAQTFPNARARRIGHPRALERAQAVPPGDADPATLQWQFWPWHRFPAVPRWKPCRAWRR
jgi:uncharacterized membrane protein